MKTDTKVCIGATIVIVAALLISPIVFHIDIRPGLTIVGFLFLIGLPIYVWSRRRDERNRDDIDYKLHMESVGRQEVLNEIWDQLDESIEKFKEWGREIKDFEKTDESAYYAEIALCKEVGIDCGRLSAEYGEDVSNLIKIRRKLRDIG